MANYSRNDPSSLSFGARLARAERDAAQAKAELADLKQTLPNSRDLQAAALSGDVIKSQRKAAKQMLGRADASLAELSSIDPSVLTPAYAEQLRLSMKDAAFREMLPEQQGFAFHSDQAAQRFSTWQKRLANPEAQAFYSNNVTPDQPKPQRSFDLWASRQDSPEGRYQRNLKLQQELDRSHMVAQAQAKQSKPEAKNRRLGGLRNLND